MSSTVVKIEVHGVQCPDCGSTDTSVINTRPTMKSIRRRRECNACGSRFTTYERFGKTTPKRPGGSAA